MSRIASCPLSKQSAVPLPLPLPSELHSHSCAFSADDDEPVPPLPKNPLPPLVPLAVVMPLLTLPVLLVLVVVLPLLLLLLLTETSMPETSMPELPQHSTEHRRDSSPHLPTSVWPQGKTSRKWPTLQVPFSASRRRRPWPELGSVVDLALPVVLLLLLLVPLLPVLPVLLELPVPPPVVAVPLLLLLQPSVP